MSHRPPARSPGEREYRCPELARGLQVVETSDGPALRRRDGAMVSLSRDVIGALMLCDGQRGAAEIAAELSRQTGRPCAPMMIERLLDQLETHDVVDVRRRAKSAIAVEGTPEDLRHTCFGCGNSCEGHLVGPLPESRVESIRERHEELAETYSRLAEHPPFVIGKTEQSEDVFLNFPDKRCVFLHDDDACLLHRHYGGSSKPQVCQSFPVVAVEVEGAIRIGLRPGCYQEHKTFVAGDARPIDLAAVHHIERAPLRDAGEGDPGGRSGQPGPYDAARMQEATILAWLADETIPLAELVYRCAGLMEHDSPRGRLPDSAREALVERLHGFASKVRKSFEGHEESGHGRAVIALLDALETLEAAGVPELDAMPASWHRFAVARIRQAVFLRETANFPSVALGTLVYALGAVAAFWVGAHAAEGENQNIPDAFAHPLTAWNRTLRTEAFHALFATPDEVGAWVRTLE